MLSLNAPSLLQQAFSPAAAPVLSSIMQALLAGEPRDKEMVPFLSVKSTMKPMDLGKEIVACTLAGGAVICWRFVITAE